MAIEVKIPKEITDYKEKVVFGLSVRQLVCFVIAIFIGVPTFLFTYKQVGTNIASYLVIAAVSPVFAIGFIRRNGFTFEKYAVIYCRHRFGKNKRGFQTNLLVDAMESPESVTTYKSNKNKEKKVGINEEKCRTKGKQNRKIRENQISEITKKDRKRKSKEVRKTIKTAIKECKRKKQEAEKAA